VFDFWNFLTDFSSAQMSIRGKFPCIDFPLMKGEITDGKIVVQFRKR
jgi:hypothetical protein